MMLLSSLISLKMFDGMKCLSDWMIHHHGPSCAQTQYSVHRKFDSKFGQQATAGSCDDRVWSTGKTMRGTGMIVFSTRVYSFCQKQLSCTVLETDSCGRSTYFSLVLTSS